MYFEYSLENSSANSFACSAAAESVTGSPHLYAPFSSRSVSSGFPEPSENSTSGGYISPVTA